MTEQVIPNPILERDVITSLMTILLLPNDDEHKGSYRIDVQGSIICGPRRGGIVYEAEALNEWERPLLCHLMNTYGAHDFNVYYPILMWLRHISPSALGASMIESLERVMTSKGKS